MKEELIKSYINKLTITDIKNYLNKENIKATEAEINLLYSIIKNNINNINYIDIEFIYKYENSFNKELFNKILEKYNKYKSLLK